MDYSTIITQVLSIVGVLVVFVNIITEVIKKTVPLEGSKRINLFVVALSIVLTVGVCIAYWQINALTFTWYVIAAFIIIGFMVAYAAMFGFDKLIKYFTKEE